MNLHVHRVTLYVHKYMEITIRKNSVDFYGFQCLFWVIRSNYCDFLNIPKIKSKTTAPAVEVIIAPTKPLPTEKPIKPNR